MYATIEFRCDTECGHWNYPRINLSLTGNYTIKCGYCGHLHYRVVENGHITGERHRQLYGEADVIHVMPSACQPTRRRLGKVAAIRQFADRLLPGSFRALERQNG